MLELRKSLPHPKDLPQMNELDPLPSVMILCLWTVDTWINTVIFIMPRGKRLFLWDLSQGRCHYNVDMTSTSEFCPTVKNPQCKTHLSGGEELHASGHLKAVRDQILHSEGQLVQVISICRGGKQGLLQR